MRFGIGCFWNGARTGLVIVLFVLLALVAHGAWGAASPRLEIEAPPELAAAGRQVSELATLDLEAFQALLGLEAPGLPIRVILVPETAELARKVPPWITGFARSGESLVVLFPERVPSYPHSSLPELVRHEIAHVLIQRAAGDNGLPRWLHEGLAMVAEGGWTVSDRSRLAIAVLRSREPSLGELSALFAGDKPRVSWAYAISGAFVRDILRRHGRQAMTKILQEMRRGVPFDQAFESTVGASAASSLALFWSRNTVWYRWVPFVTSTTVLWIAVSLLALLAIRRRRERDRALHRHWDEEERQFTVDPEDRVN